MKKYLIGLLLCFSTVSSADTESTFLKYPFFGFGVWFGGDKVATNPDGDNYDAGSGGILEIGAFYNLFENTDLMHRNSVALRYQGAKTGKGENRGVVLESSLSNDWNNSVGLGAGIHIDLLNQVSDTFGNKTKFKNSIGTIIYIEWIASNKVTFTLKYLFMDYTTEDGIDYSGDQLGVFLLGKI